MARFVTFTISFVLAVGGAIVAVYGLFEVEFSYFLCTRKEGVFYVIVCLMLLFGFLVLRLIMSIKVKYYR